jgi:hypothetical protein
MYQTHVITGRSIDFPTTTATTYTTTADLAELFPTRTTHSNADIEASEVANTALPTPDGGNTTPAAPASAIILVKPAAVAVANFTYSHPLSVVSYLRF